MIEFFIAGTPVPKARARVVRQGGKIRSYTPSKTADYEMYVKWMTAKAMGSKPPIETAIEMSLMILLPVPASWSAKKKQFAINGGILPTSKPDTSNIVKAIEDAMNGTAYKDDSQIVILKASKRYATNAGVWVSITDCQPKAG